MNPSLFLELRKVFERETHDAELAHRIAVALEPHITDLMSKANEEREERRCAAVGVTKRF